jgi:hypothetical protein
MRKGVALLAGLLVALAGAGGVAAASAPGAGDVAGPAVLRLVDGADDPGEQDRLDPPDKGQQGGMTCCWAG